MFFVPGLIAQVAAVSTPISLLSLHVLQDVGVLPQPAERQLYRREDGSRAEASESHQPSAK